MKDIYVSFSCPTLKGESADKDHTGWSEVLYWKHHMKQPRSVTASTAGGHTSERTEHRDMVFIKEIDLISPSLYQHCSGGTTFEEVTVDFMRADGEGNRVKYFEIKLSKVIISSVAPKITEFGSAIEEFTLKYAAIKWTYTKQKIGGNQEGKTVGEWSLTKNDRRYLA